jgi:hypothetical protein
LEIQVRTGFWCAKTADELEAKRFNIFFGNFMLNGYLNAQDILRNLKTRNVFSIRRYLAWSMRT